MRKVILFLISVFIITDFTFSFLQHHNKTLDGDLPGGVVPAHDVHPVLSDPLGISAITDNITYPNPNRFFSHSAFYLYFDTVPFFLQNFTDPVNSLYLSAAIFKILVQLILIFQLASLVTKNKNQLKNILPAAVIVLPFFQTNGFQSEIGIIDSSISYVFFYAFPLIFLLHYFSPFLRYFLYDEEIKITPANSFFRFLLAFPVCLSSPLNPAIVLIICMLTGVWIISVWGLNYFSKKEILRLLIVLFPVFILSGYSLFLGKYNSISIIYEKPLSELYYRLIYGVYHLFTQNLPFQILFFGILFQMVFMFFIGVFQRNSLPGWLYLFSYLFCFFYILLLPLGGFREYRPEIIRYDTLMPVTMVLIFLFTYGTIELLKSASTFNKLALVPALIAGFYLTLKDEAQFEQNDLEKETLYVIAEGTEPIIYLNTPQQIISWYPLTDPESSVLIGKMLYKYHVTESPKQFYCKQP